MTTKRCPKCKTEKPLDCFRSNASRADGHSAYCKACERKMNEEKYGARREYFRDYQQQYRRNRKKQEPLRPASGPACPCGRKLYAYEKPIGKCLHCVRTAIIAARETIPAM